MPERQIGSYDGPVEVLVNGRSIGRGRAILSYWREDAPVRPPTATTEKPTLAAWGGRILGIEWPPVIMPKGATIRLPDGREGQVLLQNPLIGAVDGNGPAPFRSPRT